MVSLFLHLLAASAGTLLFTNLYSEYLFGTKINEHLEFTGEQYGCFRESISSKIFEKVALNDLSKTYSYVTVILTPKVIFEVPILKLVQEIKALDIQHDAKAIALLYENRQLDNFNLENSLQSKLISALAQVAPINIADLKKVMQNKLQDIALTTYDEIKISAQELIRDLDDVYNNLITINCDDQKYFYVPIGVLKYSYVFTNTLELNNNSNNPIMHIQEIPDHKALEQLLLLMSNIHELKKQNKRNHEIVHILSEHFVIMQLFKDICSLADRFDIPLAIRILSAQFIQRHTDLEAFTVNDLGELVSKNKLHKPIFSKKITSNIIFAYYERYKSFPFYYTSISSVVPDVYRSICMLITIDVNGNVLKSVFKKNTDDPFLDNYIISQIKKAQMQPIPEWFNCAEYTFEFNAYVNYT